MSDIDASFNRDTCISYCKVHAEMRDHIAKLVQQVASEKEDGFAEGMERAAEMAESLKAAYLARAIRAEIDK